jgi:hypothetical protein
MGGGDEIERWVLTPEERNLVMTKNRAQRRDFAVLLLFYRTRGQFPMAEAEIDPVAVEQVALVFNARVGSSGQQGKNRIPRRRTGRSDPGKAQRIRPPIQEP